MKRPVQKPIKRNKESSLPTYLLMGGIILFGATSAYFVLKTPSTPQISAEVEAPTAASAPLIATPSPVLTAEAAASAASAAAALTASPASAPASAAVTPAVIVTAPNAVAPVTAPALAPVAVPPVAVAKPAAAVTPAPAAAQTAVGLSAAPAPKAAPLPAPTPSPVTPVRVAAPTKKVEPSPVAKEPIWRRPLVVKAEPETTAVQDMTVEAVKPEPIKPEPVKPSTVKVEEKPAPAPVVADRVRPITAPALVPIQSGPTVVTATEERAYVKIDEKRTVIIKKGEKITGLGTYQGLDGQKAKFDSGSVPISTN